MKRSLLVEILSLGAPLAAAFAGNHLMSAVDLAVVGRLGTTPLAGVGVANSLFFGLSVLGMGVVLGLDPLISQAIGARDGLRARRLLWQSAYLAAAATLGVSLLLVAAPFGLGVLGVDADTAREARRYLWARTPGLFPLYVMMGLRAYLQAIGAMRPVVIAVVVANVFNLGAVTLLTLGGRVLPAWFGARDLPGLGTPGAGLATVIASFVQLGVMMLAIGRLPLAAGAAPDGAATCGLRRPLPEDLRRAVRVGLPIGLHFFAEVGVFAGTGILAAQFGQAAVAAHQIALTLASLSFCMAIGFGSAGSVLVGRAIGAGDAAATRSAGLAAFAVGGAAQGSAALAFALAPATLSSLMTASADVIDRATPLLVVAAVFQLSDGIQGVGAGVLRGAGDTRFTFLANVAGHYVIGLPLALLFGFGLGRGVVGLWWGLCAGLSVVAVAVLVRFWRLSSRRIEPLAAPAAGAAAS